VPQCCSVFSIGQSDQVPLPPYAVLASFSSFVPECVLRPVEPSFHVMGVWPNVLTCRRGETGASEYIPVYMRRGVL